MVPNVGNIDRAVRFIAGMVLVLAPLGNVPQIWSNSVFAYGTITVGVILMATSVIRFCPLYRLFGLTTCKLP